MQQGSFTSFCLGLLVNLKTNRRWIDHLQKAPDSLNCSVLLRWGHFIPLQFTTGRKQSQCGISTSSSCLRFHSIISVPSQVVDVRNCCRAENTHICFLFTRIILFNRHSWLKGASRVFSHKPFNAGWHDEWFCFLVMVADCNSARAIDTQVSSLMKCSPPNFSPCPSSPSVPSITPHRFSALNQFPRSIRKHALYVTGRTFLALRTLLRQQMFWPKSNLLFLHSNFFHAFSETID